jgi:putative peptidoglycan binding protein
MPIRHVAQQGDSVISLSETHGFFADTIWNDPGNANLRERRADMNVLMPGDTVVIPDKRPRVEKRATGARHSFRRKGVPAFFRLQVYDMHIPRANQPYELTVDGVTRKGTTNGEGILEEYVPPLAKSGELIIGEDRFRIQLQFGHLDPSDEITGVQKRLNNLGYDCGEAGGELDELTKTALWRFQREHGLPETGEPDAETLQLLDTIHSKPFSYPEPADGAV